MTPGAGFLGFQVRHGKENRLAELFMNAQILEEAAKVVPEPQILINMVSRRVRQLSAGSRPMVEVAFRMGLADIALAEIAQGKLAKAPVSDVKAAS